YSIVGVIVIICATIVIWGRCSCFFFNSIRVVVVIIVLSVCQCCEQYYNCCCENLFFHFTYFLVVPTLNRFFSLPRCRQNYCQRFRALRSGGFRSTKLSTSTTLE